MDDIAEGPARQRGWVPGRDNEPPFSRGKCGEALVTSISNLSKSEAQLRANGPMRMEGMLELLKNGFHFDLQSPDISVDRSETT